MQFDVHKNRSPGRFPYLLDVQADLLSSLDTRVVVPLASRGSARAQLTRLMPVLEIGGEEYVAVVPQLAAVSRKILGDCVANVAYARQELIAALDLLLTGA